MKKMTSINVACFLLMDNPTFYFLSYFMKDVNLKILAIILFLIKHITFLETDKVGVNFYL
jgi:hypothetical protein